jgi:hypothetical protein
MLTLTISHGGDNPAAEGPVDARVQRQLELRLRALSKYRPDSLSPREMRELAILKKILTEVRR